MKTVLMAIIGFEKHINVKYCLVLQDQIIFVLNRVICIDVLCKDLRWNVFVPIDNYKYRIMSFSPCIYE